MIDPASIMSAAARRAQSSLPTKTRSETTISYRPPDLVPDDQSSGDESDDESAAPLTMYPAEIRVICRLSARSNVLPVIGRADSLTDEKLSAVKNAVRKALRSGLCRRYHLCFRLPVYLFLLQLPNVMPFLWRFSYLLQELSHLLQELSHLLQ